jgi:hypothetical protein
MERGGCVYLRRSDPDADEKTAWTGHWEKPVPVLDDAPAAISWEEALSRGLVEVGHWTSVEEGIAWGRARSDRVLVYLAHDIDSIYSAGEIHYLAHDIDSIYSAGEIHETTGPSPGGSRHWPIWPPPPELWPGDRT